MKKTFEVMITSLHSALRFSMLAFLLSVMVTACGKKSTEDESKLVVGSLSSDGSAVTSNITLGGYPMSLIVQNLAPVSTTASGFVPAGTLPYSKLKFEVSVNGSNQFLSSALAVISSSNYNNRTKVVISNFSVFYQAACYTSDCGDIAIEVIVASAYDFRQIVIHKDLRQNKIVKMGEWQVGWNTIRPLSDIMSEL